MSMIRLSKNTAMCVIPIPRRWLRFSLRSMLVILALCAVSIRVAQWYCSRLSYLEWKHQQIFDRGDFNDALAITAKAEELYANNPAVETMRWKSYFACVMMAHPHRPFVDRGMCYMAYIGSEPDPVQGEEEERKWREALAKWINELSDRPHTTPELGYFKFHVFSDE